MRFNRFFISQALKGALDVVLTEADVVHQLSHVLRAIAGEKLMLLDNSGIECKAVIQSMTKEAVTVRIVSCAPTRSEPKNAVTLYQSMLKKDKMEWVFEKCTEVGVTRFVPVLSARSVKLDVNTVRMRKIIKEAAEQSGRGKLPQIKAPMSFKDAVAEAEKSGTVNVLAHTEGMEPLGSSRSINIFVGPEGGFIDEEVALAQKHGFHIISLGPRTLRAETAAVVASFLAV